MKRRACVVLAVCACSSPQSRDPRPEAKPIVATREPVVVHRDDHTPPTAVQIADAKARTIAKHGEASRAAIERGIDQVASLWRAGDGDLAAFCVEHFAPDASARDALFTRLETAFEQFDGNAQEIIRTARWGSDVEDGPLLPVEGLLGAYDISAHFTEDMFTSKVAFAALLNFPLTTLEQRIASAASYDRRTWAEVRLASRFDTRIPGALAAQASAAEAAGDAYVASYNLWMHHVLAEDGARLFPAKKRLISHWNLRDEIKASYADPKAGLAKQRTIARLMDRIVTQSIPRAVIDNPRLDYNPFTNTVVAAPADTVEDTAPPKATATPSTEREPDTRFEMVLASFKAARAIDPYAPIAPTRIARAFSGAELPEQRVRAMLVEILSSPHVLAIAKEIEQRAGRKLEPHDLWFELDKGGTPETELDAITRKRYPTAAAFAADLPRILRDLGFAPARAKHLHERIAVDPSRGAGHAMEPRRRGDKARLRTRVEKGGMDYKGYNIAIHELGHNVEQVFSLYDVDHTLLAGVPNTAFTEALAFLFQARDLELLGRKVPASEAAARERLRVLDAFWNTWEIAGSALVEIDVWQWMYDHPSATAAELREATVRISRETWDRYFAPALGGKGTTLLGIYSHTISTPLYLFNYVLGHLIAFQVEEHLAGKDKATFGKEFERVSRIGAVLPDTWMQQATGKPVSAAPLLEATARALAKK